MNRISKRGHTYHFDRAVGGVRLRCSLGTHDPRSASRLATRVEFALADGPRSLVWSELKGSLPASSFDVLTSRAGVVIHPGLFEFEQRFLDHLNNRVRLGELAERSRKLYETAARRFFLAMQQGFVQKMDSITPRIVDDYCVWRTEDIQAKGGSGRGMILETTVLALIFQYAVQEGVIHTSPLKRRPRPAAPPEEIEPFTEDEMKALDAAEKPALERVVFAVFKHTGLRVSDVASLLWSAFDFKDCTLRWRTAKRGKVVEIPLGQETLIGTINGVNANFSLAHGNVDTGTLLITINNAPATNYVISGTSNQNIAFNTAPGNLSVIFAYYAYGDYWYA